MYNRNQSYMRVNFLLANDFEWNALTVIACDIQSIRCKVHLTCTAKWLQDIGDKPIYWSSTDKCWNLKHFQLYCLKMMLVILKACQVQVWPKANLPLSIWSLSLSQSESESHHDQLSLAHICLHKLVGIKLRVFIWSIVGQ